MISLRMTHPGAMAVSAAASSGPGKRLGWSIVSGASGVAAAVGTKKLLTVLWTRTTDREPPTNPADPDTGWGEALSWVVAISIGGAVARVVAQRAAATGWERAMGSPPPAKDSAPAKNS
ncbi:MAG: DUF4235 domain-containing protein [Candidatus Microthrix subdominans]|jgi:hypothetical protein|nr:DUF4235 domain-containing protein [Candidatus Microthrix sp.]MBP7595301.1 DUF4235 domain-containing protein [Candidatus Microthrix sp.]